MGNPTTRANQLTVYIPTQLKQQMREYPHCNWSKLAQEAFMRYIESPESKSLAHGVHPSRPK